MECILEAHPVPDITWYQGTKIINGSSRIKMSRKSTGKDTYLLTLEISNPTKADGGNYRCNAFNSYGESNANISLNFQGKSRITDDKLSKKKNKPKFYTAPPFIRTNHKRPHLFCIPNQCRLYFPCRSISRIETKISISIPNALVFLACTINHEFSMYAKQQNTFTSNGHHRAMLFSWIFHTGEYLNAL